MSFSLQPVTRNNWRELTKLKVREDQSHFVASNVYSIAEAQFGHEEADGSRWEIYPFGIYDGETPVGFLMYGCNYSYRDFQVFIARLMVDENRQGKGYGKFAMEKILENFRQDERIHSVGISYNPGNEVARKLYANLGFVETDEVMGEETVAVLRLR
jgi:diamine N-acetyltransferase